MCKNVVSLQGDGGEGKMEEGQAVDAACGSYSGAHDPESQTVPEEDGKGCLCPAVLGPAVE